MWSWPHTQSELVACIRDMKRRISSTTQQYMSSNHSSDKRPRLETIGVDDNIWPVKVYGHSCLVSLPASQMDHVCKEEDIGGLIHGTKHIYNMRLLTTQFPYDHGMRVVSFTFSSDYSSNFSASRSVAKTGPWVCLEVALNIKFASSEGSSLYLFRWWIWGFTSYK